MKKKGEKEIKRTKRDRTKTKKGEKARKEKKKRERKEKGQDLAQKYRQHHPPVPYKKPKGVSLKGSTTSLQEQTLTIS